MKLDRRVVKDLLRPSDGTVPAVDKRSVRSQINPQVRSRRSRECSRTATVEQPGRWKGCNCSSRGEPSGKATEVEGCPSIARQEAREP